MEKEILQMDTNQYGLDITSKTDLIGICYTMWSLLVHGCVPYLEAL